MFQSKVKIINLFKKKNSEQDKRGRSGHETILYIKAII